MHKTAVLNIVGLTPRLVTPRATPNLDRLLGRGKVATVSPVLPAVTCSVQSTYFTGAWPSEHGIVGNGWFDRADAEVKFWKQSSHLVQRPRIWDVARQREPTGKFTCANVFWWYAMYSAADYTVTPRPMYPADGRKIPDVWTNPPELRAELAARLGPFPLFKFWGPATDISSTRWIAEAARFVDEKFNPTLTLVYLPHLDYVLQRHGPASPQLERELAEIDAECGRLIDHFGARGARVIVLSEYGIAPVNRPIHLNRVLREQGLLTIREELGRDYLDAGASAAFAVADHQVAHVYVNDRSRVDEVAQILEKTPGVARVLRETDKRQAHLDHERSGDLICLAEPDAWFTYYFWTDDAKAPDYARMVDIHRKPGYDPVELFIDPKLVAPKLKIASTLLLRKLGLRKLLNVIPLDATLVRGSHGIAPADPRDGAMFATNQTDLLTREHIEPTDVFDLILRHVFD